MQTFRLDANRIEILSSPSEFHSVLIERIKKARKSVTLIALYCGCDEKRELELLEALKQRSDIPITLLFDYLRTTRKQTNTAQKLVEHLVSDKTRLYLYHTPVLNRVLKYILGDRINEIVGLQHVKIYAIDDYVLIAGANLSESYFNNRMDRYYGFDLRSAGYVADESSGLSVWYGKFIDILRSMSHEYMSVDNIKQPLLKDTVKQKQLLNMLIGKDRKEVAPFEDVDERFAVVVPTLQMNPLNIRQEKHVLVELIRKVKAAKLLFTSGYMNPPQWLVSELGQTQTPVTILSSSIRTNGFYNGSGLSFYVPFVYEKLLHVVRHQTKKPSVQIQLWDKSDWSYHCKGFFWCRDGVPFMTSIGSSNFNLRSENRDLEHTVFIATSNPSLRQKMLAEYKSLVDSTIPLRESHQPFIKSSLLTLAAKLLKSYL